MSIANIIMGGLGPNGYKYLTTRGLSTGFEDVLSGGTIGFALTDPGGRVPFKTTDEAEMEMRETDEGVVKMVYR